MSVDTVQVLQIAHKKKTQITAYLRKFKARTAFRGICREFSPLGGYEPKIEKEGTWYMTTVLFSVTNWDSRTFFIKCGDEYLMHMGSIDGRDSYSPFTPTTTK